MRNVTIRMAKLGDAADLLEIYAPYVTDTAVTFEYSIPSEEEFKRRIKKTLEKYPYIVAEENGEIIGYCYASPFNEREAYNRSVETSIYIKKEKRRAGLGRKMYEILENILKRQNVLNMYACIACTEQEDKYLTNASVRFHEKMGFKTAGKFNKCGYKFNNWYDMVWMEKFIGEHERFPSDVIPISKLDVSGIIRG